MIYNLKCNSLGLYIQSASESLTHWKPLFCIRESEDEEHLSRTSDLAAVFKLFLFDSDSCLKLKKGQK